MMNIGKSEHQGVSGQPLRGDRGRCFLSWYQDSWEMWGCPGMWDLHL